MAAFTTDFTPEFKFSAFSPEQKTEPSVPSSGSAESIFRPFLVPMLDRKTCITCLSYLENWEWLGVALYGDIRVQCDDSMVIQPCDAAQLAIVNNRPDIVEVLLNASSRVDINSLVLQAARDDNVRMIDLLYEYHYYGTMGRHDISDRLHIHGLSFEFGKEWTDTALWTISKQTLRRLEIAGIRFDITSLRVMANRGDYELYRWMYDRIETDDEYNNYLDDDGLGFIGTFEDYKPRAYDARIYRHIAGLYKREKDRAEVFAPLYIHALNDGRTDIATGVMPYITPGAMCRAGIRFGSIDFYRAYRHTDMSSYDDHFSAVVATPRAFAVKYGRYDILKRYRSRGVLFNTCAFGEVKIAEYPALAECGPIDHKLLADTTLTQYDSIKKIWHESKGDRFRSNKWSGDPHHGTSRREVIHTLYRCGVTPSTVPAIKWVSFSHGTDGIHMAIHYGWRPPREHFDCPESYRWYSRWHPECWATIARGNRRAGFRALARHVCTQIKK